MMKTNSAYVSEQNFEQQILQGVSRSFALTIPQLPPALSSVVTNAYLLCRITDTIEDEVALTIDQKSFFFQKFIDVISGKVSANHFADELYPLLSDMTLPAEKELIRNTALMIRTTLSFDEKHQAILKRCVTIMSEGMLRFQKIKSPYGLKELSDMDSYCFYVAGVVGEMLTGLFCEYSEEISENRKRLFEVAASFGQGLQMTNILKDLWDDKERGVCWLPQDIFQKAGFDLKNLSIDNYVHAFGDGLAELIGITHAHLKNALAFTLIIPPHETGIRKFCLWAIGMAILTLRNINKKRNFKSGNDVKISKRSLKAVITVSNATLKSNYLLKTLFNLTTRGLPEPIKE